MGFLDSFKRKKKGSESAANSKQSGEVHYEKGNFIGRKYEVYGELGHGGFGIVYLVYSHETKEVYALKTFKDEYLADAETRKLFRREANVWIELERHSYVVRAYFVEEVAGRLYIGMEYIAKDEQGLNTLQDYLTHQPPDLAQSLRWAVQFCYGMEHAYLKGVRCHRDIKPANIMISHDKTVKITDFGLAGVLGSARTGSGIRLSIQQGRVGLSGSIMEGRGCGTPTHMPPEQFTDAARCDERSDIYAFGVVLYQMAGRGRLPFDAPRPRNQSREGQIRYQKEMYRLHCEAPIPQLNSLLFPIIQRCLQKEPSRRYQTFKELRADLESLLKRQTGEPVESPELKELDAWEWSNKGFSLGSLGRFDEAIECYDKALEINPQYALAWINKGVSLDSLGRFDEAIRWYDQAIKINPQHAEAWNNKGNSLGSLGRFDEAIECYDKALEINPQHADAWYNKGASFYRLGRLDEAIECYDKALEINPQHAGAWNNKGVSLDSLGRFDEAIRWYDQAIKINPQHAGAWYNKGNSLKRLGRLDEAIKCHDKALEINPQDADAWYNKALAEDKLDRKRDAAKSFRKFIELAPDQYAQQIEHARQRLQELGGK